MKKIKLKFLLCLFTLFILSSCGMYQNDVLPHLDGVTFSKLTSFTFEEKEYSIALPSSDETFYLYKQSDKTTNCKRWTINYSCVNSYIPDDGFVENQKLYDAIYTALNDNISTIYSLVNDVVVIHKNDETIQIEETLINNFDSKVSFMYFDKFLPIRLTDENMYSYTISIPLSRKHLLMDENYIQNPFENNNITLSEFYNLPKLVHNIYY